MVRVSEAWSNERGDLHDATVTDVRVLGTAAEIQINDEWINSRGLDMPEGEAAPGTLVVEDFAEVEGSLADAIGGWLDGVTIREAEVEFTFTDREAIRLHAREMRWRSDSSSRST